MSIGKNRFWRFLALIRDLEKLFVQSWGGCKEREWDGEREWGKEDVCAGIERKK